jgi:tetratricopeptide (TPR) repeat protein
MELALRFAFGLFILLAGVSVIGWAIWRSIARADDPGKIAFKYGVTFFIFGIGGWAVYERVGFSVAGAFIVPFVCVAIGVCMSLLWAPHLGAALAKPLTSIFDGGDTPADLEPFYSVAESRRKQGRFMEAIYEVQRQLDKFPTDVTGQMMLASIQAENLDNLPAAQITIERLCQQPGHTPPQIANAWNALADWHLKLQDTEAARAALERIIARYPDTEQAQLAAQRIGHLASKETLLAAHEHKPIQLRHGVEDIGLMKDPTSLLKPEEDPAEVAGRLVKHLDQHPLDNEVREKLAIIYAEHYQRLDLAADQFEQLIADPTQPGREVARWLNTLADLQLKHGADYDTIRQTLQRVIDLFPDLAAAQLAQQRIELLRLELKGKEKSQVVKLGSYEKDLGLKGPRPPA